MRRSMRTEMSIVSQSKMYKGANMSNKGLRMSNYLVRISIVALLLLFFYLAFLLIGIDFDPVLRKLNSMLLGKGIHFLFSRLGWFGLLVAGLVALHLGESGSWSYMFPGASGPASSSGRPTIDLNLPPADEPEPASTSDQPQEEVELRRQMEEHILRRLIAKSPPSTNPYLLANQARETAQLKRQMVDRMPELDPDHSPFWREQRYRIITDSILTNREQADYAPHRLRQMLRELSNPDSPAFKRMLKIRKNFQEKGTFRC